ncbi:MAG: plastocyanin/azurin family copper-binding protein [Gemmatimonadaceae bacterium]
MRPILSLVASIALFTAPPIQAQSLLDRSPNVSGDWTGSPGTLYFNFVHRFSTSGEPERKVTNVPTFLLAAGLPKHFLAGVNYSTNSTLAARYPNEWEAFLRWLPFSQDFGAPLDIGGQIGYNNAAQGVDGEVSLARSLGIARFIVAGRTLSDPTGGDNRRYALAGAAVIRVGTYVALTGDVASMNNRDSSERVAWSAGLHFAIPLTPHTVSLQATNTLVNTLQGASRGTSSVRYGFEFTIPLTLRRYFGRRAEQKPESDSSERVAQAPVDSLPAPTVAAPAKSDSVTRIPAAQSATTVTPPGVRPSAPPPGAPTPHTAAPTALIVRTGMKNINYLRSKLDVVVGTTVEWTNHDPLPHSVTAVDRSFNSGLIAPGKTYRHTFTKVGTFNFFCMPHPFMKGTIVVRDQ